MTGVQPLASKRANATVGLRTPPRSARIRILFFNVLREVTEHEERTGIEHFDEVCVVSGSRGGDGCAVHRRCMDLLIHCRVRRALAE